LGGKEKDGQTRPVRHGSFSSKKKNQMSFQQGAAPKRQRNGHLEPGDITKKGRCVGPCRQKTRNACPQGKGEARRPGGGGKKGAGSDSRLAELSLKTVRKGARTVFSFERKKKEGVPDKKREKGKGNRAREKKSGIAIVNFREKVSERSWFSRTKRQKRSTAKQSQNWGGTSFSVENKPRFSGKGKTSNKE